MPPRQRQSLSREDLNIIRSTPLARLKQAQEQLVYTRNRNAAQNDALAAINAQIQRLSAPRAAAAAAGRTAGS